METRSALSARQSSSLQDSCPTTSSPKSTSGNKPRSAPPCSRPTQTQTQTPLTTTTQKSKQATMALSTWTPRPCKKQTPLSPPPLQLSRRPPKQMPLPLIQKARNPAGEPRKAKPLPPPRPPLLGSADNARLPSPPATPCLSTSKPKVMPNHLVDAGSCRRWRRPVNGLYWKKKHW